MVIHRPVHRVAQLMLFVLTVQVQLVSDVAMGPRQNWNQRALITHPSIIAIMCVTDSMPTALIAILIRALSVQMDTT